FNVISFAASADGRRLVVFGATPATTSPGVERFRRGAAVRITRSDIPARFRDHLSSSYERYPLPSGSWRPEVRVIDDRGNSRTVLRSEPTEMSGESLRPLRANGVTMSPDGRRISFLAPAAAVDDADRRPRHASITDPATSIVMAVPADLREAAATSASSGL